MTAPLGYPSSYPVEGADTGLTASGLPSPHHGLHNTLFTVTKRDANDHLQEASITQTTPHLEQEEDNMTMGFNMEKLTGQSPVKMLNSLSR